MSSFSHLSASHNSNNGNPKKHWRAPVWCDSAIWEAARRFAGITHRRIRRRRAPPGSWCCGRAQSPGPRDRSLETSVLGLRKSPSVHCSKPTAPLAYGWCRRKHHVFSASAVPKVLIWEVGFLEVTSVWLVDSSSEPDLCSPTVPKGISLPGCPAQLRPALCSDGGTDGGCLWSSLAANPQDSSRR